MTADYNFVLPIVERFIFNVVTMPDYDYLEVADRIEDFETRFLTVFDLTYPERVHLIDMIETAYQERFGEYVGE